MQVPTTAGASRQYATYTDEEAQPGTLDHSRRAATEAVARRDAPAKTPVTRHDVSPSNNSHALTNENHGQNEVDRLTGALEHACLRTYAVLWRCRGSHPLKVHRQSTCLLTRPRRRKE